MDRYQYSEFKIHIKKVFLLKDNEIDYKPTGNHNLDQLTTIIYDKIKKKIL